MGDETTIFFDEMGRSLRLDGAGPVTVRAKSFAVFMQLARAYPDPVSKDDLIRDVWNGAAVSDDSITQSVATIRRALGDKDHRLLQTNPGQGYVLMVPARAEGSVVVPKTPAPVAASSPQAPVDTPAPVGTPASVGTPAPVGTPASVGTPAPVGTPASVDPAASVETAAPPAVRRSPLALIGAFALLIGLLGGGLWFFLRPDPAPHVTGDDGDKPSVAVLSFDVLGTDSALTVFAQGLQSDIIVALSELDTVSVLSPTILAGASGGETPLRAYAAHGARYVVGGTIQSTGSELRISGHLIDTETSRIVWTRPWNGATTEMTGLQAKVVAGLAGELANPWSGHLTGLGADLAAPGASTDPAELIRAGAAQFEQFHDLALQEAERSFRKALEIDANNADAWSGLSFVLGAMLPLSAGDEAKALRDARANSGRQAYHLGDGSGRSLLAGSWTAALRGNRRETLRRLKEAAALLGSDSDGLAMASIQAALTTDLYQEAIDWGSRALELRTDAPGWYRIGPAYAHFFAGDPEQALTFLRQTPDGYAPTMALLASIEHAEGNLGVAQETAARLRMLHHEFAVQDYLDAELIYPEAKQALLQDVLSRVLPRSR